MIKIIRIIKKCNLTDLGMKISRSIMAIALSIFLVFSLAACTADEAETESDTTVSSGQQADEEHRLPTTRCVIDITGDYESYAEEDSHAFFSFFYKKPGEDEWKVYSVFECDGEEKDIELIEGHFLIHSGDIGEREIYVDDTNDVYSIKLDYTAKTIDFQKIEDN